MDLTGAQRAGARGRCRTIPRGLAAGALALVGLVILSAGWPAVAGASASAAPVVHAPSVILIDRVSGRILYGRDIHHRRPMASTTKIMTALLVLEHFRRLNTTVTAPAKVAFSSGIGIRPGQRITVEQALLALMVKSANDAGVTLANAVAGSERAFVGLMNAKARRLGLRDTRYDNATGSMRDHGHRSSVYDLAKLARYAMRGTRFRDLVRRRVAVIHWGPGYTRAVRGNNLLLHFDWADGVKCGFTPVAGYCLVGSGQPGLRPFISATLKAPDRDQDARDHVALYEWGSTLFEERAVVTAGDKLVTVPIVGGGEVRVAARTTLTAVVRSAAPVQRTLTLPARFAAEPPAGTIVGSATFTADGVRLGTVRLVVVVPVPEPSATPSAAPESDAASAAGG